MHQLFSINYFMKLRRIQLGVSPLDYQFLTFKSIYTSLFIYHYQQFRLRDIET